MDTGLIITIIILIIYLNIDFLFKNLISVKATTNNEKYTVQDNENKQENANKLGIIPIIANFIERNKIININAIPIITTPRVKICDLNKLCNILL